jgi:hypothetical protein
MAGGTMKNSGQTFATLSVRVDLPDGLAPFAELAAVRLSYLFKEVNFSAESNAIVAMFPDTLDRGKLRREIAYAAYREKIFADTLPMRTAFFDAVTRR